MGVGQGTPTVGTLSAGRGIGFMGVPIVNEKEWEAYHKHAAKFFAALWEQYRSEPTTSEAEDLLRRVYLDRPELVTAIRHIYESGSRVAQVEGEAGAGKTTLLHMFCQYHADLFPGGLAVLDATLVEGPELDIPGLLPGVLSRPGLIVLDNLDRPGIDLLPTLRQVLSAYPQLRILTAAETAPRIGISDGDEKVVSLGDLNAREVRELLMSRLQLLDEEHAEEMFRLLMHDQSMIETERRPYQILKTAAMLLSRRVKQRGLVGPDGRPLSTRSREYRRIVTDVSQVNDELLRRLKVDPELMCSLPSRKFEELVAEILARMGYVVSLTPATKDGGFDIYAAAHEAVGTFLYLVECKRYAPTNKVGVEVVRALHGTVHTRGATAGLLVTTSYFTAGAEAYQKKNKYTIQLHDYLAVQRWLSTIPEGGARRNG